jgi:hypothetical protein
MSTELGKFPLERVVRIYELGMTRVILTPAGITFKMPETKLGVSLTWPEIVEAAHTPDNVQSIYEGRPLEFLKRQAAEALKRSIKKIEEKETHETQV